MKIHGHARIELRDQAGNVEVIEHDNILTTWLQNVLRSDVNGGIDFSKIFPIKDWFGGCFLISDDMSAEPTNTMLPKYAHITAHAGGDMYETSDNTAGLPNTLESGEITNGYKFVWDWSTSSGNGDIKTICLTHKDLGKLVNTNRLYDGACIKSLGITHSLDTRNKTAEDTDKEVSSCVLFDNVRNIGYQFKITNKATTDAVTIIEKRVPMCNVGILDDFIYPHIDNTHIVSVNDPIDKDKISLHLDENHIWIVELKSSSSATIHKISRADFSVTHQTLTWSGVSFDTTNNPREDSDKYVGKYPIDRFPIVGDYIYFLDSTKTTFYKCNHTNVADVSVLQTTFESPIYSDSRDVVKGAVVMPNGNVAGYKCYIRGDVVYPFDMSSQSMTLGNDNSIGGTVINDAIAYVNCTGVNQYGGYNSIGVLAILGEMVSTINPLDSVVTKTADRTMKLVYTIRMEV